MAYYCSDCEFLNEKKKKADGLYECKKIKKNVLANAPACDKFEESYSRNWYQKHELYDKAKNLQNDPGDGSIVPYLIGLGLMLLFCILATIRGFA